MSTVKKYVSQHKGTISARSKLQKGTKVTITLPGDLTGMDVYHHIRKTDKTVPVLFISGNIEFLESIQALKQNDPYIEHVSKPCQNIDYVNCINKMLGRRLS